MNRRYFAELIGEKNQENLVYGTDFAANFSKKEKKKVHILAMGDVGGTLLTGLHLLGGDVIEELGICDIREEGCRRWEAEVNQITFPFAYGDMPFVSIVPMEHLFECDVFIFCASKAVPAVGAKVEDVRMIQLVENEKLVRHYAKEAAKQNFSGLFAVVSDPVDPLCFAASDKNGLLREQIKGYGLGVMNARAAYYAKKENRFSCFLTEGRAFGPHGQDLVIANSIEAYDDEVSRELTKLSVEANLRVREAGYKPFVAPAYSSGAISILLTLRGNWHYSSCPFGGVYFGMKNRLTKEGGEIENLALPDALYQRLWQAYQNLKNLF